MTLKIEDGTGVSGANAYVDAAFVTSYLTDRNRETENSWDTASAAAKDGAVVAATDFIEQRWSQKFKGKKEFSDVSAARATLTFTGQPSAGEAVTIDTVVFTFGSGVAIGASVEATIDNLVTAAAAHATVSVSAGVGDTLIAVAKSKGTAGNGIATTETVTAASWSSATLLGGGDVLVPQPLSFPRLNLTDRDGLKVLGIPEKLRQATAEYAVRALSSTLMPDPTVDPTGRAIVGKREKVGPIEEETTYQAGGGLGQLIRPYPAADRLLSEYVSASGTVIRG